MEKVSIIVPMFNCEKSISKLMNSLLKQTYKNIEILLINDESTDNTVELCKTYFKDSRIKIISQKHLGVSAARNNGIKNSTGKFICFCDADDYLELNAIEKMVTTCEKNNVELVMSGHYIDVYSKNFPPYIKKVFCQEKKYPTKEDLKKELILLWEKPILTTVWDKLYITDIIKNKNIYFEDYDCGEDVSFNQQYLLNISSAYILSDLLYHYTKNGNLTLSEKYIENLFEKRKKEFYRFIVFFNDYGMDKKDYEDYLLRRYAEKIIDCIKILTKSDCPLSFKVKTKEIKKIMNDKFTIICFKHAKFKTKKLKLLAIPFKLKLPLAELFIFSFINFARKKSPQFFNKIKRWANN